MLWRWNPCCRVNWNDVFIEAPITIVDGEKRIYYSTHKYSVVEYASLSYLFAEIEKALAVYETLLTIDDSNQRSECKLRWINCKNRIRCQLTPIDTENKTKLKECQKRFRDIDARWRNTHLEIEVDKTGVTVI
jgi:hypothetical protein